MHTCTYVDAYSRTCTRTIREQIPEIEDTWMKLELSTLKLETAMPAVATFLLVALFDCRSL